jgi:VWFA-related protein
VRGRRKTILFVSEGIDYDITDFQNPGTSLIMDATRETLAAAARGNVSIYGIDPRGLTNLGDQTIEVGSFPDDTSLGLGTQSLQNELRLSQAACGSFPTTQVDSRWSTETDFSTAFDRIVRDNSSYYAMAYYPPSDKAGKFHKIEVRVRRPDLRVRARQGYVTLKPASPAAAKAECQGSGSRDQ